MLQKIGILMNEIKEKEESIRASELKVLHSQINPHFIYNTLDTIVWMAEMGNAEKVVDISKAMASFFRLSLRGGSELTTIREELNHVRQYLIIQKERYMDKLSFEIIMDDEIADISIPKIILQPLAENAIYHGIRFLTGNGMIKIKAEKIKNEIILTVEDNGVGFDIGKPYKKENSSRLGGVGLQNVDERIHLYYGQGSGLDIFSEIGIGTKVTVKIKI
jgi:two-component system sensor histidine kinase YesM